MREPPVETQRWACVTAGEYDRGRHVIVVNAAVVDAVARAAGVSAHDVTAAIVAHERLHATAPAGLTHAQEEAMARAAAVAAAGEDIVGAIERLLRTHLHAAVPGS
jgi:hypothetical protein